MTWCKSVDFPEPETPQRPTSRPSGSVQEKSRRLLTVAPSIRRRGVVSVTGRGARVAGWLRPLSQAPVTESLALRMPVGFPA